VRVLIVHQDLASRAAADDLDVLQQVELVRSGLLRLGHTTETWTLDLDLRQFQEDVRRISPDIVFYLVESLGATDRLQYLAAGVLDTLAIPYTGCATRALFETNDKLITKARLKAAGLPTPAWLTATAGEPSETGIRTKGQYLIKSAWEHASAGLVETLHRVDTAEQRDALMAAMRHLTTTTHRPWFAEQFIDGREFNLSLLGGSEGPEVLPPAEIDFSAFPPEKPRIVGYKAKWDEGSFEYHATPRRFDFPPADRPLLAELERLAVACWHLFELRGYARVDFRVGDSGQPFILEVNANPCLSPDAGFMAAVAAGGYSPEDALSRILADSLESSGSAGKPRGRQPAPSQPLREDAGPIEFRRTVIPEDAQAVRRLAQATGFFHADEIDIAVELVQERLAKGEASGYEFIFAEDSRGLAGYTCFGPIPCTGHSWDLYWIAVAPDRQGQGLGKELMVRTEAAVRAAGGTRIYIDTSSREQYAPTRAFYQRCGYRTATILEDFYAPADGKVILEKRL